MKEFLSAIDIGSSLTRVVVGRLADESLEVVGVGAVPSRGVRGGVVVNIENVVQSIADAAREAELMSGMIGSTIGPKLNPNPNRTPNSYRRTLTDL